MLFGSSQLAAAQDGSTAEQSEARTGLYDVLGRRVATLHNGALDAGPNHRPALDGHDLSSGLYLVRVVGERFAETRRVVVAR